MNSDLFNIVTYKKVTLNQCDTISCFLTYIAHWVRMSAICIWRPIALWFVHCHHRQRSHQISPILLYVNYNLIIEEQCWWYKVTDINAPMILIYSGYIHFIHTKIFCRYNPLIPKHFERRVETENGWICWLARAGFHWLGGCKPHQPGKNQLHGSQLLHHKQ